MWILNLSLKIVTYYFSGMLVSGGLQQYLIRQQMANNLNNLVQQPRKGLGSDIATFHDLPVSPFTSHFCIFNKFMYQCYRLLLIEFCLFFFQFDIVHVIN